MVKNAASVGASLLVLGVLLSPVNTKSTVTLHRGPGSGQYARPLCLGHAWNSATMPWALSACMPTGPFLVFQVPEVEAKASGCVVLVVEGLSVDSEASAIRRVRVTVCSPHAFKPNVFACTSAALV